MENLTAEVRRLVDCAAAGDNPSVITTAILTALRSQHNGATQGDKVLRETEAAANIIDCIMGGDRSWRERVGFTDIVGCNFLESADWLTALEYARAALSTSSPAKDLGHG